MAELKGDYRRFMDKNFFGVWDLDPDGDTILTIDHTSRDEVQNERGKDMKFTIHWAEDKKPLICNKTNAEAISKALSTKMVEEWKGKRIALYSKQVPAFGGITDAVRVREYPPKETDLFCEDCGQKITAHDGFSVNKIVTRSRAAFGRDLCWDCSIKAKEASNVDG